MLEQDGSLIRARHGARELLIKALYQWQLADHGEVELTEQFANLPEFERIDQAYFRELLHIVLGDVKRLDSTIGDHADRKVEHVDAVSRAVLLLGLAELNERDDVPTKVIINEAVELAKRYGPSDCFRFVNAVLDGTAKKITSRNTAD